MPILTIGLIGELSSSYKETMMLYRYFIAFTGISIIHTSMLAQETIPLSPHLQQQAQNQSASSPLQNNALQANSSLGALCYYTFTAFSCFSVAVYDGFKAVNNYNPNRKLWYKCKEICRIPFTAGMYAAAADRLETTFMKPSKKKSSRISPKT